MRTKNLTIEPLYLFLLSIGVFLFCLLLSLEGCHKKVPNAGEKSGSVEGYVLDSADSNSISGAGIFGGTEPDSALLITRTDSTGYYRFADFATIRKITASADVYKPQTKTITIKWNQVERLDFLLERK